ncbi:MAG: heavy metal efflux pump, cobalt-zinc-cadmium [Verrucomicrobiales bacterium]|nr:heavy metal efflux pump, cobalt-zinc-cadmium [Verrucomicrobiales bacterium]
MLNWIVQHALRFRAVVLTLACVLIAYGVYVSMNAKLDVFPEFVTPQVVVQTESPGLAPEQVEAIVTRPVESALSGVSDLQNIRSESIQGLSVVTAVFKEGTDIFRARQMLAEKLTTLAGELPPGVKSPKMSPLTSSTMDILKFGLISTNISPVELHSFAEWTVRPRLLAVPGVAKVSVFGGDSAQLQIQVRPDRLVAFNLTVQDVLTAAKSATGVRGAGFIENANQRVVLQTEGQSINAAALGEVAVAHSEGKTVRLKDVANVVDGIEPKFGDSLIMGRPGVLLTVSGQYGANTLEVTRALESALEEMKPLFANDGIQYVPHLHRPANFIQTGLRNVQFSLLLGGALVAVILFLFLLDVRSALISFLSIPLSLLTAVIILNYFDVTINTMTLGGFAVAIGVVVDDGIIDVENILRRLRQNIALPTPRSVFSVILEASLEVRSAIVYATFIVALVFLPVLTMTGLQGRFFAPLAVAFILATLASLAVALTVTPALCYLVFSRIKPHEEPRYISWLKTRQRSLLSAAARWPKIIITVAALLVIGACATLPFFGGEFLPEFRERHFVVQLSMVPGTSLQEMLRVGAQVSKELLENKKIESVEQQVGRAEMGEDTWGPQRCEFHVELKPDVTGEDEEAAEKEIRELVEKFPGAQSGVQTFLGDRIGESVSGETASVVVNLFCENLDVADEKARQIASLLQGINGAADVQVQSPPGVPRIAVALKPERLTQFGFRPLEVLDAIELAFQGNVVGQVYQGNRVTDVAVILGQKDRQNIHNIESFMVQNDSGLRLPLRELASIYTTAGRYNILHEGARRRQTVTCNTRGRDVTSFVAEAKQKLSVQVQLPKGAYIVYSGAAQQQAAAQRELLLHSLIAAVAIIVLLAVIFGNWRNLMLVLANVPFALVGGVLAAFFTGVLGDTGKGSLSLGSMVGLVTLFGITMRNSIMMISHFEHLVTQEGMAWGPEAALRGATERLVPILMTALVTALGLLPLAIGTGEAGREIEGPMSIVILGGLLTSTVLNLLVLPTLALRWGRFERRISSE